MSDFQGLLSRVSEAANLILKEARGESNFLVVSHFDADGLAAAGIMGKTLARLDAPMHLRVVKQLDGEVISECRSEDSDVTIFTEIGSGYLDTIQNSFAGKKTIILDHHQPSGRLDPEIIHVNPHQFGFDGATEVSGAGIAYFVARSIADVNVDLSTLAVVGALGDMQDKGTRRSLHGLNEKIVEDGLKKGLLETATDLIFYGRETRPIHRALAYTTSPFLPGISGEEDNCLALLASIGIQVKQEDRWRTVKDLSNDEKQRVLSKIIEVVSSKGLPGRAALELIGTVYTLVEEESSTPTRDAREYASLLNACGRMDRPGLAISICLGDRGMVTEEVQQVLAEYRKTLAQYMEWVTQKPDTITELRSTYYIRGDDFLDEKMTGALSSILSNSGLFKMEKAIIVATRTKKGEVKVSARASDWLVERGVNLGAALQAIAEKCSGMGGGHNVAAGAQIPEEKREDFIKLVDAAICNQIKAG